MDQTLEQQVTQLAEAVAIAERQAKTILERFRKAHRIALLGDVAAAAEHLTQLPSQLAALEQAVDQAKGTITYDTAEALTGGAYLEELKAEAKAQGVVLNDRDGRLTAFPLALRLEPKSLAVRIGRKLERGIRPSRLVKLLKQAQASAKSDATRSLAQMFKAYQHLAPAAQPGWRPNTAGAGPIVSLTEIYDVLTLHPAAAAEYPREAFAVDLLRLDKAPDSTTSAGHRFTLPASTGSKGRDRIAVFDETGAEHAYASIQFSLSKA